MTPTYIAAFDTIFALCFLRMQLCNRTCSQSSSRFGPLCRNEYSQRSNILYLWQDENVAVKKKWVRPRYSPHPQTSQDWSQQYDDGMHESTLPSNLLQHQASLVNRQPAKTTGYFHQSRVVVLHLDLRHIQSMVLASFVGGLRSPCGSVSSPIHQQMCTSLCRLIMQSNTTTN